MDFRQESQEKQYTNKNDKLFIKEMFEYSVSMLGLN